LPSRSTIANITVLCDAPDVREWRCGSGFDRFDYFSVEVSKAAPVRGGPLARAEVVTEISQVSDLPVDWRDAASVAGSRGVRDGGAIRPHPSHHRYVTDPTDEILLLDRALEYNGYERIAGDAELIFEILRPLRDAVQRDGVIPEWAGVDLLRAWAFWIARAYHWSGGYSPLHEAHPELWMMHFVRVQVTGVAQPVLGNCGKEHGRA
jgi:hypothetical protein